MNMRLSSKTQNQKTIKEAIKTYKRFKKRKKNAGGPGPKAT